MKVSNIKNDFMTWIGAGFLIADLVYFIVPLFVEVKEETSYLMLLAGALIGLGLMLAPQDLYGVLKDKSKKL